MEDPRLVRFNERGGQDENDSGQKIAEERRRRRNTAVSAGSRGQ